MLKFSIRKQLTAVSVVAGVIILGLNGCGRSLPTDVQQYGFDKCPEKARKDEREITRFRRLLA